MKELTLTRGMVAVVDDADFDDLSRWKWQAIKGRSTWYAIRFMWISRGHKRGQQMHRQILGLCLDDPRLVDHRDGNGLNNQRSNLRTCTPAQNVWNSKITNMPIGRSGRRGVSWDSHAKMWKVQVMNNGVRKTYGYSHDLDEAAALYEKVIAEIRGEFAITARDLIAPGPIRTDDPHDVNVVR